MLGRLFQLFEQGAGIDHKYGGLGLGMAISKALVDIHAGSISADSQGSGLGAEFTIILPSIHATALKLPRAAKMQPDRRITRELHILLVEDHEDSAEVMSRFLRAKGYDVKTCATLSEALAATNDQPFDLVLCDIGLPDGTGIDWIRSLRQRSSVPAVALTGFGMMMTLTYTSNQGSTHISQNRSTFKSWKYSLVISSLISLQAHLGG